MAALVHRAHQQLLQRAAIRAAVHLAQQAGELAMIGQHPTQPRHHAALSLKRLLSRLAAVLAHRGRCLGDGCRHLARILGSQQLVFQAADVLDLAHRVHQAAKLLDGHVLVGLALGGVQQLLRNVGLDALFALALHPLGQALALVDRLQAGCLAQVEALQQRVDLIAVLGIQPLDVAVEAAQVLQPALDLLQRLVRGACALRLQQLVALFGQRRRRIAALHRRAGSLRRTGLGAAEHAWLERAHLQSGHRLARELPCRLSQQLDFGALGTGGLRQCIHLGGHHARACRVVHRRIGLAIQRLWRGQLTMLLDHALIDARLDFVLQRVGRQQGLHQLVAAGEAEQLRHDVRVHGVLAGGHAQVFQALPHRHLAGLGRAIHLAQAVHVKPAGAQSLGIAHLVARAHFLGQRRIAKRRILRPSAQFIGDQLFQLSQIVLSVFLGGQVAIGRQQLGHGVGRQPAVFAEHRLAEHPGRRAEVVFVHAQVLAGRLARDAAQLGDGHQQRISFSVQAGARLWRCWRRADLVGVGQLVGQESPGAIDRLGHDLLTHVGFDGRAQAAGLLLQRLQLARTCATQPLQIAQAARLQLLHGVLCALGVDSLVGRPRLGREAGLLSSLEQGEHAARLLGGQDGVIAGQHAVEHLPHLGRQLACLRMT